MKALIYGIRACRPQSLLKPSIASTPRLRPSSYPRTVSTAQQASPLQCATTMSSSDAQKPSDQTLPLPEPSTESSAAKLDVSSGQGVKLDHLGPMVVNKDGTLSRIANWEHMTEIEKRNTVRILGKRNMLRIEALEKDEEEKGAS
ncbi:hypothetical protein BDV96DRAFT_587820 [Lophiotrema nucula]|uniref:Uncharacterized protein n=1 Tax=Lophiotrema nucula TaxID=690887 RepID=A0A6A5YPS2_9PLEO|nr:hypothetical protein BDV96DRAFT_587820 [Lophiotrema nucula]